MKNTQKILIAVLVLVFVAVVVFIIAVKSDKTDAENNEATTSYALPEENEISESITNASQSSHNHEQGAEDATISSNGSDKNASSVSGNPAESSVQNSKNYDLTNAQILQTQRSSFGEIRLLSAKSDGNNVYLLEATVENKKFYFEFPGYYIIENIYFANVDGRYGDEVIVHSNTGNVGIYNNIVLKITPNGIESLINEKKSSELGSSFTSTLKSDFNVEISNKYTNKKKTVNVKGINNEDYTSIYWDENGKITEKEKTDHVWFNETFYRFEPQDTDEDGVYEIICSQHASLGDFSSKIGYAQITLKYDTETKQFKIIDSNFTLSS